MHEPFLLLMRYKRCTAVLSQYTLTGLHAHVALMVLGQRVAVAGEDGCRGGMGSCCCCECTDSICSRLQVSAADLSDSCSDVPSRRAGRVTERIAAIGCESELRWSSDHLSGSNRVCLENHCCFPC